MARAKLDKLVFSGREQDFTCFMEQFEARMYMLKLDKAVHDKIKTPKYEDTEEAQATTDRVAAEEVRDDLRYQVWCELVQCLDRKSIMFIRAHKPNGTAAWKALVQQFKSSERPRIQKTMTKLTGLKMEQGETISDYLIRGEELQMDLQEVGESVSDAMFKAIVLKGLSRDYDNIVTLMNHGEEKGYPDIKQNLINFANNKSGNSSASAFMSGKNFKCNNCNKAGHKEADCRQPRRSQTKCYNCEKTGHMARDCRQPQKQKCEKCNRTNHTTDKCWKNNNNNGGSRGSNTNQQQQHGNFSRGDFGDDHTGFSFMSVSAPVQNVLDINTHTDTHSFSLMAVSAPLEPQIDTHELLIDSGCTGYMMKDKDLFVDLDTTMCGTVGNANKSESRIQGTGTVQFWVEDSNGKTRHIELKDASYVPSYSHNLISVGMLNIKGVSANFEEEGAWLTTSNGTIFPLLSISNLFILKAFIPHGKHFAMKAENLTRWHQRLGHNNKKDVAQLQDLVDGMQISGGDSAAVCAPCATQKAKRTPVKKTWGTRATKVLDIVHADTLGPLHIKSIDGYQYAIGFIDSFSRHAAVYLMKTKDESLSKLQQFVADIGKPRTLVTDGAMEYNSAAFNQFCREQSIRHEVSTPYMPEDNGKIERVWGTVVGMARCMVEQAHMPKSFWSYALLAAFYLKNRSLHSAHSSTPFEVMFGTKPNLSHLKVFGCKAYAYVERQRKKLDSKAQEGVFLGYCSYSNSYLVSVPSSNGGMRLLQTRSVTFNEDEFYFNRLQDDLQPGTMEEDINDAAIISDSGGLDIDDDELPPEVKLQPTDIEVRETLETSTLVSQPLDLPSTPEAVTTESDTTITVPPMTQQADVEPPRTRSGRVQRKPAWMEDYLTGNQLDNETNLCMAAINSSDMVPRNATEALKDSNWEEAMQKEYDSLVSNKVWELVQLPSGRKQVSGKWHFVVKHGADGKVLKYKARYCARGFTQIFGQDYNETYSPTVKLSTLRCMWALAAQQKCQVYQMDIKTAYLNADIEEEIYLKQPDGFVKMDKDGRPLVCLLLKSIYGLKQSGRNWYQLLVDYLLELGFKPSPNDPCLFTKVISNVFYYVSVWVDDIIYFSTDPKFYQEFKAQIEKKFTIGDLSKLSWFLGMQVTGQPGNITVNQKQYIESLLANFGMAECKPVSTPIAEKMEFKRADCPADNSADQADMRHYDYRGLVGSLNYLATTSRPDISFVAHTLSSYLNNPGFNHWTAAKHVLRYLRGTADYQLTFNHDPNGIKLVGWSDSDYAGQLDTRKSTSGVCFSLHNNGACISWMSKLQPTVATSTAEAEINAATEASKEAVHLQQLLASMGFPQSLPTTIWVDNQAAIAIAKNPVQQTKTKHYAIKLLFVRELVLNQEVVLTYIPTEENNADIFTKGLGRLKTQKFTSYLLGLNGMRGC